MGKQLYNYDDNNIIGSSVRMFADDTKLWRKMQSKEDELILQQDLGRLEVGLSICLKI